MARNKTYRELSKKLRFNLVKRLDGNWEKIDYVDGLGGSDYKLHVCTFEGHEFWCRMGVCGRYFEVGQDVILTQEPLGG